MLVASGDGLMDQLLAMALSDAGYAVAQAVDHQEALESLRTATRPVVVLQYVGLPHPARTALLPAVGAVPELAARHAFVLVTPYAEGLTRLLAGLPAPLAVSLLNMPFDLAALLDAVAQAGQRLARD
jgi:DNA-binding NtrC family response regulator